jgi:hypothetical protein
MIRRTITWVVTQRTRGVLQLFEFLGFPDTLFSETRPFSCAELDSAEHIVVLRIGRKLKHLVWQTKTSNFSKKTKFSLIRSKT